MLPCRNLLDSYYLGRVIGAGSFGVVREGIEVSTGRRFAVKTVSKVPKRGAPTPRYAGSVLSPVLCCSQHHWNPGRDLRDVQQLSWQRRREGIPQTHRYYGDGVDDVDDSLIDGCQLLLRFLQVPTQASCRGGGHAAAWRVPQRSAPS